MTSLSGNTLKLQLNIFFEKPCISIVHMDLLKLWFMMSWFDGGQIRENIITFSSEDCPFMISL